MIITERRGTDRRLRGESSTGVASSKVIAQVLHDARQQAATISALTQIMARSLGRSRDETAHLVSRAASQLIDLLGHPLGAYPAVEVLPLWRMVEDLVVAARLVSSVRFEVDIDESALISADPILLRRATGNLLDNAIRSAGAGGRVHFGIEHDAESTYMIIEDSGPGFGGAPNGRRSLGLGVVFEFLGSVHGTFEIRQSDLGGALLSLTIPRHIDDELSAEASVREGLAV